ncbi:MAG: 4-carboxy-4-hydroxy-2-oxoadipate aldolase/oxaloacetate decarboxylase [Pigmentiphaga sp.]|nr:4-carboxy-4-hydroxy-2-oxoadipate aldolase/oxaloacetate decarboxylase [Pigmentiphaga sp.]
MASDEITSWPSGLLEAFAAIGAATAHECQGRTGALSASLKPLAKTMRVCGPAYTLRLAAGDNLGVHYAIKFARPGDVVVIDANDYFEAGPFGEILALAAKKRGLGGLVTTGSIRDSERIREMNFPVFCKGVSMKGTAKEALPQTDIPIVLDGVNVHPGDLILGDADGVVVVRRDQAAHVLEKSLQREASEKAALSQVEAGAIPWDLLDLDRNFTRLSESHRESRRLFGYSKTGSAAGAASC